MKSIASARFCVFQPSISCYRFGFNGQEKDDEVSGIGNTMTAEFWEYDSRLGRRWNVDPVVYANQSGYLVFNNNPIVFVDPFGLEGEKPKTGDNRVTQDGCRETFNGKSWEDRAPVQLKEAVVKGIREEKRSIWNSASDWTKQTIHKGLDYLNGFGLAFTSDFAGRRMTETPYNNSNRLGSIAGHRTAMLFGGLSVLTGLFGDGVGVATAPVGGAVVVVPATAIAAHGVLVISTAYQNMLMMNEVADEANGNVSSNGAEGGESAGSDATKGESRIQAGSLKEYKSLVQKLSKPGSELTKSELEQFEKLTEQFGGKLRYDLNPVKGKILRPHVQVEGLGPSVGSRHIWLKTGVK